MDFYLRIMIKKTAFKFISDPSHILHGCYKTKRFYYQMARARNSRFFNSFVPFRIHTLNNCFTQKLKANFTIVICVHDNHYL